jgi:hypothetical protein
MDIEFTGRARVRRALRAALALTTAGICVSLAACQTTGSYAADGTFIGRLSTAPRVDGPFVVIAVDGASDKIVHRAFLGKDHRFELDLPAGNYKLYAFVDSDGNGHSGADEAMSAMYAVTTPLRANDRIELPALEIGAVRGVLSAR